MTKLKQTITALLYLACIVSAASVIGAETDTEKNEQKQATASKTSTSEQDKANSAEELPNPTLKLESVFVGDKEQPAISYFIPWQGIGTPDNLHWNVEEKHDKALDLVDREIMLRSIHFYEEMQLENPELSAQ